jgi:hypothetical protein
MKGPTDYSGQALPQQSSGAFGEALTGTSDVLNKGAGFANEAGGLFSKFGGMTPSDVSTQTLSNTDLSPYMNPFTKGVIDTSMNELRRQEDIGNQAVGDAAMNAHAFGGDRMQVQQSENRRNFNDLRAKTLAELNQSNFGNAQQMAQTDIARKLQADQSNQNMRYGMSQSGASGLSGLGTSGVSTGLSGLGNLANMGFGMGNTLAQNQLASGAINQKMMQSIIDAMKGQYEGYTGAPDQGLDAWIKSLGLDLGNAGSTKTNSSTWEKILGGVGAVGSLLPW